MKKVLMVTIAALGLLSLPALSLAGILSAEKIDGATKFKEHCAVCHPNGGNIVNPKKTLDSKTLAANGIKTAKDIIAIMRNPGPGMTKFDTKTISDTEAKAIANYILKAFSKTPAPVP